jgi:hypothetical protein
MPCYDPPPPWEGKERESTEKAARLLCKLIGEWLNDQEAIEQHLTIELLKWYIDHRKIDLEMVTTPSYGLNPKKSVEIRKSISLAVEILEEMKKR